MCFERIFLQRPSVVSQETLLHFGIQSPHLNMLPQQPRSAACQHVKTRAIFCENEPVDISAHWLP